MTQIERNKSILVKYIPEQAVPVIAEWIYKYNFKLKIKKSRTSKYGDYRPPLKNTNHQITINHDLNPYSFLITLIHEVAHLTNWEKNGARVKPHGDEWKQEFKILMRPFIQDKVFPEDVKRALVNYMRDPAASSCSDIALLRVLRKHDDKQDIILLEEIPANTIFRYGKDRHFIKGERVRKRFLCKEIKTKRDYLFNPLSEVFLVSSTMFNRN